MYIRISLPSFQVRYCTRQWGNEGKSVDFGKQSALNGKSSSSSIPPQVCSFSCGSTCRTGAETSLQVNGRTGDATWAALFQAWLPESTINDIPTWGAEEEIFKFINT